jgi:hypothetical protein
MMRFLGTSCTDKPPSAVPDLAPDREAVIQAVIEQHEITDELQQKRLVALPED